MITPEYLDEIIKGTENAVSILHEYLIGRIAKHITAFIGRYQEAELMPSTIKEIHQLMESGVVYADVQRTIEKEYPKIQKEIKQAFLNSAAEISKANTEFEKDIVKATNIDVKVPDYDVNAIPTKAADLNLTDFEVRLLESDYRRTNGTVKNLTKTTAVACQNAYIEACDNAFFKVQHGTSMGQAISEAINDVSERGVGVVLYGGNRRENVEVAIARAVRTGITQANADIVLARCAELNIGYVSVSEHMGARVTNENDYTNHSWWQGKAYKLDWNSKALSKYNHEAVGHTAEIAKALEGQEYDYPDFVTTCGYGELLGICGVNCRHTFSMFFPDMQDEPKPSYDSKENEQVYKETQRARAMERAIRKTKRKIAGLESSDLDIPQVAAQLSEQQTILKAQLDAYRKYCREHRLKPENWRIQASNGTDIGVL